MRCRCNIKYLLQILTNFLCHSIINITQFLVKISDQFAMSNSYRNFRPILDVLIILKFVRKVSIKFRHCSYVEMTSCAHLDRKFKLVLFLEKYTSLSVIITSSSLICLKIKDRQKLANILIQGSRQDCKSCKGYMKALVGHESCRSTLKFFGCKGCISRF